MNAIQVKLEADAPVFANTEVSGLDSGVGVTLGVGTGVLGSGLGAGALGSGVGVGAGGSGLGVGALGSGVGAGALGSGVGVGAGGSGLGAGALGSGVGVGAGGSGVGVGAGGSGLGAGALGSGVGMGAGGSGLGAGALGSGFGVGAGGVGGTHCSTEGLHSIQPFPVHSNEGVVAWDVPPKRRAVPMNPRRIAPKTILRGVRFLGLFIIFPFRGRCADVKVHCPVMLEIRKSEHQLSGLYYFIIKNEKCNSNTKIPPELTGLIAGL